MILRRIKNNYKNIKNSNYFENTAFLKTIIKECLTSNSISEKNTTIIRQILRYAEIKNILCDAYHFTDKVKPAHNAKKLESKDINDFLKVILIYYVQEKDLKILNGFFKLVHNNKNIDLDESLLKKAESYLHGVKLYESC